jgi:outer membrane lipoprotein-sorting protein
MRRSFIGAIHRAGSNPDTRAASLERHPNDTNLGSAAIPVAPSRSASRNPAGESPNGETTPTPAMEIGSVTTRTLSFRIVKVQNTGTVGVIVMASLVMASLLGARPVTGEGDLFDELYARGQAQNAGLKTLTAAFVETSTSSLLTRPVIAHGIAIVERPSRVALRYADPEARVILIDGDRMTLSWPSANIRNIKDIGASQRRIQSYFVDSSPGELRSHFQISASEAGDRPGTYLITMVPKRKQILEGITRLELWLDRGSLLLAALRMTFPGGDTKLMTFTDVKPNAPVDPAWFTISGAPAPSR